MALLLLALFAFAVPAAAQRRVRPTTPPPTRIPPPVVSSAAKPVTFELDVAGNGVFSATMDAAARSGAPQWSQFKRGSEAVAGVHGYFTPYRGGQIRCDIRISNGSVNADGTGFCGEVFFKTLSIRGPPGMEIARYLRAGETVSGNVYSLTESLPAGDTHSLPARDQFTRSFMLCAPGGAKAALEILDRASFPFPAIVKNFGPLNATLPTIDRAAIDALFKTRTAAVREALRTGAPLWIEDWAQMPGRIGKSLSSPDGEAGGDNPGGFGIELLPGDRQTRWGLVYSEVMSELNTEGRPIACYNAKTGEPMNAREWASAPLRQNMNVPGGEIHELPAFLAGEYGSYYHPVFNPGFASSARDARARWRKYDGQHAVRVERHLVVPAVYTGARFFWDSLEMVFVDAQLDGWSNRPDDKENAAAQGEYQHPNLREKLFWARAHPHQGGWFERGFGWQAWRLANLLKVYPGRSDLQQDADAMLELFVLVADQFGITANAWWHASDEYFPGDWSGLQTFHGGLVDNGIYALCLQRRGKITPDVLSVLEQSWKTMYRTFPLRDMGNGVKSPPKWIGLANNWQHITDLSQAYLSQEGDPCPGYPLHIGALLYSATGNMEYVNAPLLYWHPHATLVERRAWCEQLSYRNWSAAHEAILDGLSTNALTRTRPTWD